MTSSILARRIDFLTLWRHHYHLYNLTYEVNDDVINCSKENLSRFNLSNPCGNLKKCACVVLKNDFPVPLSCESIKTISPVVMGHALRGWLPSTCVMIPWLLWKMRVGIIKQSSRLIVAGTIYTIYIFLFSFLSWLERGMVTSFGGCGMCNICNSLCMHARLNNIY